MLVGDVVATGWCIKGFLATQLFVRQHDEYGSIHSARRVDERHAMTKVLISPVLNWKPVQSVLSSGKPDR